jgi:hypothetical protein
LGLRGATSNPNSRPNHVSLDVGRQHELSSAGDKKAFGSYPRAGWLLENIPHLITQTRRTRRLPVAKFSMQCPHEIWRAQAVRPAHHAVPVGVGAPPPFGTMESGTTITIVTASAGASFKKCAAGWSGCKSPLLNAGNSGSAQRTRCDADRRAHYEAVMEAFEFRCASARGSFAAVMDDMERRTG